MVLHVSDRLSIIIWVKETIRTLTPPEGCIASLPMNDIRQELMLKLQIVKDAKALIADPENWTTGELARDAKGLRLLDPTRPEVCSRCLEGALETALKRNNPNRWSRTSEYEFFGDIKERTGVTHGALCDVNDNQGFDAVHTILDKAAASYEKDIEALDAK